MSIFKKAEDLWVPSRNLCYFMIGVFCGLEVGFLMLGAYLLLKVVGSMPRLKQYEENIELGWGVLLITVVTGLLIQGRVHFLVIGAFLFLAGAAVKGRVAPALNATK